MSNPSEWPVGEIRQLERRMLMARAAIVMARLITFPPRSVLFDCRRCGAERRSPYSDPGFLRSLNPPATCALAGHKCQDPPVHRSRPNQHHYVPGSLVWYTDEVWARILPAIVEPCPDGNRTHVRPADESLPPDECSYFITVIDEELETYRGGFILGSQLTTCYTPLPGAPVLDIEDALRWNLPQRLITYSFVGSHAFDVHPDTVRALFTTRSGFMVPPSPQQALQSAQAMAQADAAQPQQAPGQLPRGPPAQEPQDFSRPGPSQERAPIWHPTRVEILSPDVLTQAGIDRYNLRMQQPRTAMKIDCTICGVRRPATFDDPGFLIERPGWTCAEALGSPECFKPPRPRVTNHDYHFVPGSLVWYMDSIKQRWAAIVEDPPDGTMSYVRQEGLPHHRTSYYITLIGPEGMFAGGYALCKQLRHLSRPLNERMTKPSYPKETNQALNNLCVDLRTRLRTFSVVVQILRWRAENALEPGPPPQLNPEDIPGPSGVNTRPPPRVEESDEEEEEGGGEGEPTQPPRKRQRGANP